jgi:hypothetical protein
VFLVVEGIFGDYGGDRERVESSEWLSLAMIHSTSDDFHIID